MTTAYSLMARGMTDFTVRAVLTNCFIQGELDLGGGVSVRPLAERMGFRGETSYVVSLADDVGFNPRPEFVAALFDTVKDKQPMAILRLPTVVAETPEEAGAASVDLTSSTCDTLSLITTNSVDPIAIISSTPGDCWYVRLLPPQQSYVWHLNGYFRAASAIQAHVLMDDAYRLLNRLFRIAQSTEREDVRLFHYIQILEVAGDEYGSTLVEQIRGLVHEYEMSSALDAIPARLDIELSAHDCAEVLKEFRNAMAHEGHLSVESVKGAFAHPFLAKVPVLLHELRELVRFLLLQMASRNQGAR